MQELRQPNKRFADAWDIAQVIVVIVGIYFAYQRMNGSYVLSAMGTLFLLMALEPTAKKEISLRGKVVMKKDNPRVYFSMIAMYIAGAVICFLFAVFP